MEKTEGCLSGVSKMMGKFEIKREREELNPTLILVVIYIIILAAILTAMYCSWLSPWVMAHGERVFNWCPKI